jgi:ribonuclease toxin BrnT of type II toxin-antitoxin system
MRFIWDAKKAAANSRKHGVSFEEASTAFEDDLRQPAPIPITPTANTAGLPLGYQPGSGCWPYPIPKRKRILFA